MCTDDPLAIQSLDLCSILVRLDYLVNAFILTR